MTEADVMSPCQADSQAVITMGNRKFVRVHETQVSLHDFIANETIATDVIGWLLVQEDDGKDPDCTKSDANDEMAWHEAYTEHANIASVSAWFRDWWTGDEN